MKRATRSAVAAAALAGALMLTACSGGSGGTADGIEVVNEGKLTTCTHLSYKPFQYEEGGEVVGFDVDLVDLVAKDLGVEQEIENTPFETITTGAAFNNEQCDVAAAGMTITDERAKVIDFADPYFKANQSVLAKGDSGIKSEADLAGKKLAAQTGTTGLQYAEEKIKDAEVITYEDLPLSLQAIQNGDVDAVINDNGVLYDFAKENTDYTVGFDIETGESYGIAVKKGNTELKERINEVLKTAKEDGRYAEIYKKWFNTEPPEGF
ncbi:basic amino acid ABC transporter substrate-binding protein [Saxibacter everestensis]|uniref:Basic amino acid ABC transporter substrate-binding protein n=1 Tax=Saxibacter everestensis TaxID=2909229 RepID=A0ABY8QQX8_9MICO|nr:basic amino acid ABC transporter substrate-binding protein [Brevibacteriaceae bacterium ZFBP1038]